LYKITTIKINEGQQIILSTFFFLQDNLAERIWDCR